MRSSWLAALRRMNTCVILPGERETCLQRRASCPPTASTMLVLVSASSSMGKLEPGERRGAENFRSSCGSRQHHIERRPMKY
jgi:hypothetical protein